MHLQNIQLHISHGIMYFFLFMIFFFMHDKILVHQIKTRKFTTNYLISYSYRNTNKY